MNQTIGLEAVSLLIVPPWSAAAAVFVIRGDRAGSVLAVPPAAYAAYMFPQYVVGPQYLEDSPVIALHLSIFVLSGGVLLRGSVSRSTTCRHCRGGENGCLRPCWSFSRVSRFPVTAPRFRGY